MKIDYSELSERYSAMDAEDFDLIQREDLIDEARPYYDREKAKRFPGWRYEGPHELPVTAKLEGLMEMQRRMKRGQRLKMAGWMVGFLFLLAVSLFVGTLRDEFEGTHAIQMYINGVVCILGPVLYIGIRNSARTTGYVVLWLRRFHRREQKPFQSVLDEACMYTCMPITVQDTSFRNSMGFAMGRLAPFFGFMAVVVVVLGLMSAPIVLDVIVLAVSVAVTIALIAAHWLGFLKFRGEDSEEALIRLVERVQDGKVRNGGVLVLQCSDATWQGVVEQALRRVDAVLVDVTQPSENVIWELRTALRFRAPEGILLACAREDMTQKELPEAVRMTLQAAVDVPLERFPKFLYPGGLRRFERKGLWISGLREALVRCISNAPARETSRAA
jgi:hypothetical protein